MEILVLDLSRHLLCELSLIALDILTYNQYLFVHWLMCIYVTSRKIHR